MFSIFKSYLQFSLQLMLHSEQKKLWDSFYLKTTVYVTKNCAYLMHFFPIFPFGSLVKHQKTIGYLMFLGGMERVTWENWVTILAFLS